MQCSLTAEYGRTGLAHGSGQNEKMAETAFMACLMTWQQQTAGIPVKNFAGQRCSLNNLFGDCDVYNCQPADGWPSVQKMTGFCKSVSNRQVSLYTAAQCFTAVSAETGWYIHGRNRPLLFVGKRIDQPDNRCKPAFQVSFQAGSKEGIDQTMYRPYKMSAFQLFPKKSHITFLLNNHFRETNCFTDSCINGCITTQFFRSDKIDKIGKPATLEDMAGNHQSVSAIIAWANKNND